LSGERETKGTLKKGAHFVLDWTFGWEFHLWISLILVGQIPPVLLHVAQAGADLSDSYLSTISIAGFCVTDLRTLEREAGR
jgi:uncharacterized membrane protein